MTAHYLILTETLDKGGARFIADLQRRHPDRVVRCYTANAKAAGKFKPLLPPNVHVHVYDKNEQAFDNSRNAYVIARHMTRAMAGAVERFAPDFFRLPGHPYDFNTLYQFGIQFTIARHKLNFFYNAMRTMSAYPDAAVIFLNQPYLYGPSWKALQHDFPILARPRCSFVQTRPLPAGTLSLDLKQLGQEWKYRLKRLKPLTRQRSAKTGSVLTYARARHHLAVMEPTLSLLSKERPISVLNYFPKKFKAENPDFYAGYKGLDANAIQVLNPRAYIPSADFLKTVNRHFSGLAKRILNADCAGSEKQFYWDQLEQLQLFMKQVCRLESIIRQMKPEAVCGCMEVDAFGFIFMELRKTYPFKLINHLHGIAPHFEAMDFCRYDAFFIWNRMTRDVLLADGYPDEKTLRVVGNPFWEKSGDLDSVSRETEVVLGILEWKGPDALIVAYSQPETNYSTPHQRTEFFRVLFEYLEKHETVKLLVKTHPNEFDDLASRLLGQTSLGARVRFYKAKELPLYDSFRVADLAASICSTVLLEALYYHIPAVSIDFEGVNATLGNHLDKVVPLVSKREDVPPVLNEILDRKMAYPGFSQEIRSLAYPDFKNAYSERIAAELAGLGLLENPRDTEGQCKIQAAPSLGVPEISADESVLEGV